MHKEKIAVIPIGYSDGYPSNIAGKGFVLIKGNRYPLIGGITSNHLVVKLEPESRITQNTEVVLIGYQGEENISAHDVAKWAGVSTYKVLIGLNPLLPKKVCRMP